MSLNFKPLADRVLIRRMPEREETDGGIYKPEFWRDKEQLYVVEAVGDGKYYDVGPTRSQIADALSDTVSMLNIGEATRKLQELGLCFGQRIPLSVEVGDVVLMGRYEGTDVKIDGVDYNIVREEQILAVVPRSNAA